MGYLGLEGKVALVTGGNSGIGRVTAIAFAEVGAKVVIAARDVAKCEETVDIIRRAGGDCIYVKADVAKPEDVQAMVSKTIQAYGRLDCAVNNAGVNHGPDGVMKLTVDWTEEDFDHIMGINLRGTWLCLKYEIPEMIRQGGGAIVNVSSCGGLVYFPKHAIYSASKAGIQTLTKATSSEHAKQGIRVNTICPGVIETPLAREALKHHPELRASAEALSPMGRFGTEEETAAAILWLCSDKASFVNGVTLAVDGGWTQH